MKHIVPQTGQEALEFDGQLLSRVSSETSFKKYWTELAIYITVAGTYIVEVVGGARNPDDITFRLGHVCAAPEDVFKVLRSRNKGATGPSQLALTLLEKVAEIDDNIAAELDAREAQTRLVT